MNLSPLRTAVVDSGTGVAPPLLLTLSYFAVFFGESLWRATFANYAIDTLDIEASRIPFYFALAALPGTVAFAVGIASVWTRVHLLVIFSILMLGGGLVVLSMMPGTFQLAVAVLSIGIGFHSFYVVSNSLCLLQSKQTHAPIALGKIRSVGPLAGLLSGGLVFLTITSQTLPVFLAAVGACIVAVGFAMARWARTRSYGLLRGRLSVSRALWPYYLLNFLAGSRSALFTTFVIVMLIDRYGVELKGTAALLVTAQLVTFCGYRLIGSFARRFDPRAVLTVLYSIVAVVFLSFAVVTESDSLSMSQQKLMVQGLFLLDSLVFGVSVVTDGYLKSRVEPSRLVGTVAVGSSLFHGARVVVPVVGGLLWMGPGPVAVFGLGCVLALAAIFTGRRLV